MIGRHVAPAGAPIRGWDIVRWTGRLGRTSESAEELRAAVRLRLDRRYCALTCTGRAALAVLLSALKSLAPATRNEVILPSYTCYSVVASAVRAGLRPRVIDISRESLDFDMEKLGNADFRRVLAVVPTSLYGLPGQLAAACDIARDRGVFLVDDAAQSLGASFRGRPCGGWGHAAVLSFDKGKAISAIDGGAIVADEDEIAAAVGRILGQLPRAGIAEELKHAVKLGAYVTCLRPEMYWIPSSLPGLGLGRTEYDPNFALRRESPWLAALGATMWPHLDEFSAARVANAAQYRSAISQAALFQLVQPAEDARPTYLRFPVLVPNSSARECLLRDLKAAGIGATVSYPASIADIPEVAPHLAAPPDAEVGRSVAKSIVTLPTHPYVNATDIGRAVAILSAAEARGR